MTSIRSKSLSKSKKGRIRKMRLTIVDIGLKVKVNIQPLKIST